MDLTALMKGLDGSSILFGLAVGLVGGFVFAMLTYRFYGRNFRRAFERVSDEMKKSYDSATEDMRASFRSLSSEALTSNQQEFLSIADRELNKQTAQHSAELDSKKELIDQQLRQMSKQMSDTLHTVPTELEKNQAQVSEALDKSTVALRESNQNYLNQLTEKAEAQSEAHSKELESKKELIDTQLRQMSDTLGTVPTELEKSQKNVGDIIEKTTKALEEKNKAHLSQLQEKANTQTKEHFAKLDEKELLINRRLSDMDEKLGKVQKLIDEFEKARENKLGALDDQLKSLTATTSSLQRALADNQARGQWGERIAEQILEYLGLRKGFSYKLQEPTPSGERPDFTFLLPNRLTLNMDCKFPIDNYLRYLEAESDNERDKFSKNFLRNVEKHVTDISKRDYINTQTVDCALIFIPNEQIYRFIHEQSISQSSSVIDTALRNKVILCSPMTLYIVLAVIRQAAESLAIEQKSREIFDVMNAIKLEWGKYTDKMKQLENTFGTMQKRFHELNGTRANQMDRRFEKIDSIIENSELSIGGNDLFS